MSLIMQHYIFSLIFILSSCSSYKLHKLEKTTAIGLNQIESNYSESKSQINSITVVDVNNIDKYYADVVIDNKVARITSFPILDLDRFIASRNLTDSLGKINVSILELNIKVWDFQEEKYLAVNSLIQSCFKSICVKNSEALKITEFVVSEEVLNGEKILVFEDDNMEIVGAVLMKNISKSLSLLKAKMD